MSESFREEALRLAREAGFGIERDEFICVGAMIITNNIERLIALARQRQGWKWVPEEPTGEMMQKFRLCCDYHTTWTEAWNATLAAAPRC